MRKNITRVIGVLTMALISSFCFGYSGGSGTEADPYLIADKADLLELGNSTNDYVKCFKMTADIDLSGEVFTDAIVASSSSYSWSGTEFTGIFDGDGHYVQNLNIDDYDSYLGLFGRVGNGGIIRNLGVTGDICAYYNLGGIAGYNSGTISNCYSSVDISFSSSAASSAGSLCGYNKGNILDCYAIGNVDVGDEGDAGGLVGYNDEGSVERCYSLGQVAGDYSIGGLIGFGWGACSSCFWDMNTSGMTASEGGIGKTTAEMQTESTFTVAGWDFVDTWQMGGYPVLQWQGNYSIYDLQVDGSACSGFYQSGDVINLEFLGGDIFDFECWIVEPAEYSNNFADITSFSTSFTMPSTNVVITADVDYYSGGTGSEADPYLIATKEDLLKLSEATFQYDKSFIMTENIDLAGESFTLAVIATNGTEFTGTFDGGGYYVQNLNINDNGDYLGLFGRVGNGGIIRNLAVTGDICGYKYLGGIAAYNSGTISNCYSSVDISSLSAVISTYYAGSLCGSNYGNVLNCYATGNVDVGSGIKAGGLIGYNFYGVVEKCYSLGQVDGNYPIGGLIGNGNGTVSSCFWDMNTSGMTSSAGGTGKTTAEMQMQTTFETNGWNFVDTWYMAGYPELRGFISEGNAAYQNWLIDSGVSVDKQGYSDDPAGDGIQNLLKYAIGLNPIEVCSTADLMELVSGDTNSFSVVYKKSKYVDSVELFPTWTDSLLITNWLTSGFEFEKLLETSSNEIWKASIPMNHDCEYIRLNAEL